VLLVLGFGGGGDQPTRLHRWVLTRAPTPALALAAGRAAALIRRIGLEQRAALRLSDPGAGVRRTEACAQRAPHWAVV
jgi:hypothetical protein